MRTIPFKGLVDPRPYPPTGLTTQRWKAEVNTMMVALADLWLTQSGVRIPALFGVTSEHGSSDTYPHAVSWQGELYLEDGHHRVVRQAMAGTCRMRMRVYTRPAPV